MDNSSNQDEQAKERARRSVLATNDKKQVDDEVDEVHELVLNTIEHGIMSDNDFDDRDSSVEKANLRQQQAKQHADIEEPPVVAARQTTRSFVEQTKAVKDGPPRQQNDHDFDDGLSRLSAGDIPIPTELQRHETAPGAVGVRGIAAQTEHDDSSHLRFSVTGPPPSSSTLQLEQGEEGPKSGSVE